MFSYKFSLNEPAGVLLTVTLTAVRLQMHEMLTPKEWEGNNGFFLSFGTSWHRLVRVNYRKDERHLWVISHLINFICFSSASCQNTRTLMRAIGPMRLGVKQSRICKNVFLNIDYFSETGSFQPNWQPIS